VRDSNYYSSASMSRYIDWVLIDRLGLTDKESKQSMSLVLALTKVEFVWRHPMDENRAIDGLELRDDFEYETGEYLDKGSGLMPHCTFFEMLAALAIRCEEQHMRNLSYGDRTSRWFFEFLDNLGLLDCDIRDVSDICEDFMDGKIDMFPTKSRKNSLKNEQIWKQLGAYINEKYKEDGANLELFT